MERHQSAADTAARKGGSKAERETEPDQTVYVGYYEGRRARVVRVPGSDLLDVAASREHVTHSQEFEWGYNGSGPAQLALALLLDYYGDPEVALACYQRFCRRVVSDLETDASGTWRLTGTEVELAVAEIREATAGD